MENNKVADERRHEVVTPNPDMDGAWESDTIGENEPRSFAECESDIEAFQAGECGPDMVADDYYIRNVDTGEIAR
jgi:hypothetical protein